MVTKLIEKYTDKVNNLEKIIRSQIKVAEKTLSYISEMCANIIIDFEEGFTLVARTYICLIENELDENMKNFTKFDKERINKELNNLTKKLEENQKINKINKEEVKGMLNNLIEKLEKE